MAQVRRNLQSNIATRNQENARIVGKNSLLSGKAPAATKRTALGEIGNENSRGRGLVAGKKVETKPKPKPVTVKKENEPVVASSNNISIKARPPLKKTQSSSSLVALEPVEDIDKNDKDDPLLVGDYVNDIYDYLRELEVRYPIREKYLEGQQVTPKMRALLMDWLVDVHLQFHLLLETLYLTVSIIDRYLQEVNNVSRKNLQLVGVAAMYVACKYEEMYSPIVTDFVYICDNAYTIEEILDMEQLILNKLDYSFCRPLPLHFLRRYSKAAHAMMKTHQMSKYILELCIVEYEMCHYPPSLLSAAALYLGLWLFSKGKVWTKTLEHYTTYKYEDIEAVVKKLATIILKTDTTKCKAVIKKYASSKFLKVSCMPELRSDALRKLAGSS